MNNLSLKEKVCFIIWVLGLLFITVGSLWGIIDVYINTEDIAAFGLLWFLAIILCLYLGLVGGKIASILEKLNLDKIVAKITTFLFASIFAFMFIGFEIGGICMLSKMLSGQESYSQDVWFFILFPIPFLCIIGYFILKPVINYIMGPHEKYFNYIEENKVALGRFTRPVMNDKRRIVLANKYIILDFDIYSFSAGEGNITLTDKINAKCYKIELYTSYGKNARLLYDAFIDICQHINYETPAEDILKRVRKMKNSIVEIQAGTIFLDINKASEAEFTALPGMTIAKAKHVIKMRKKYAFYLSINQFYETAELENEFIEQISVKGNKIILNKLPEYRSLETKE